MAECSHVFMGKSDGVHCLKCGMHMTAEEYCKFLNPETKKPAEEKPKRQTRKKVKTDE